MRLFWLALLLSYYSRTHAVRRPLFLLVDGFTDYLSGYCRDYCKTRQIELIDVVSPYTCGYLEKLGRIVPDHLRGPMNGDEEVWIEAMELEDIDPHQVFCLSESDAGLSTAERIQTALKLSGNGVSPQLRNKYLMNERIRKAGLKSVDQCYARSWEEAKHFIQQQWTKASSVGLAKKCVIKPYRGVASDGVFLCNSMADAKRAFQKLFGSSRYAGGINDAVLVQEYADGPEYAVDTVTCKGETKVVALWKYEKIPANGAPFCYQCTNLVSASTPLEIQVCNYCIDCLKALGLRSGPTHTEIKYTNDGPRLIEVNARWHAQNFVQIVRECVGYDAVTVTMDSLFDPQSFRIIPCIPAHLASYGRIVHLISYKSGIIREIRHVETINALSSVRYLHLPLSIGDEVEKTIDIRTDCGYVLLINEDPALLESDYRVITALQKTMFEVHESFPNDLEVDQEIVEQEDSHEPLDREFEPQNPVEFIKTPQTLPQTSAIPQTEPFYYTSTGTYPQLAPPYPQPLHQSSPILQSVESPPLESSPSPVWRKLSSAFLTRAQSVLKIWKKIGYSLLGLYLLCHFLAQTSPIVYLKILSK